MCVEEGLTPWWTAALLPGAVSHLLVLSVQLGRDWGSGEPPPGKAHPTRYGLVLMSEIMGILRSLPARSLQLSGGL